MPPFKLSLELHQKCYNFIIQNKSEIPVLAQNFCQQHDLTIDCVQFIIDAFNSQIEKTQLNNQDQDIEIYNQIEKSKSFKKTDVSENKDQSLLQETYEKWTSLIKDKVSERSNKKENSQFLFYKSQTKIKPYANPELFDNLYHDAQIKQQKVQLFENIKQKKLLENCTFRPKVNRSSSLLALEKDKQYQGKQIHEKLIEKSQQRDQQRKKFQQEEFNKIHTFQPNGILNKPSYQKQQAFFYNQEIKKREKEYQLQQKRLEKTFNFTPQIKKDKYHQLAKQRELSPQIYPLPHDLNLKPLFRQMDSDNDGLISPSKIDLSRIPVNILQDVLFEIDERNLEINLQGFKQLLQRFPEVVKKIQKYI